jgi:hypothetical protein
MKRRATGLGPFANLREHLRGSNAQWILGIADRLWPWRNQGDECFRLLVKEMSDRIDRHFVTC